MNDVYLRGKKVCGILTEASFGLESGVIDYAVLGIGINVYPPQGGFPEELNDIAGTVLGSVQKDGKNRLAAALLNRFMEYYTAADPSGYVDEYRRRSLAIGRGSHCSFSRPPSTGSRPRRRRAVPPAGAISRRPH